MPTTDTPSQSRRAGRAIRLGLVLVAFAAVCAAGTAAFNLGFMHGAAAAAVAVVIYSVPAALFDWPRITLADVIELFSAMVGAIASFLESLFDW